MSEAFFSQLKKTSTPLKIKTGKKPVAAASQTSPLSATSNRSMDNLRDLVKKLQCDVKKLELNLKLVDSDNMTTADYDKLKGSIGTLCGDDGGNTEQFFNDMDIKRGVNFLKRVLTYLQMIAPICGILNLTAVPFVMSRVKSMEDTPKSVLLEKCFNTFKMAYQALSSATNTITFDVDVDVLGLIENATDVDMADGIVEVANPISGMEAVKKSLFDVANSFSDKTVKVAKRLLNPFKNNPNRGPRYNLLIEKCNRLWSVICLSMWLYIILMNLNKTGSNADPSIIMTAGGKKSRSKSSKSYK